MAAAPVYFTTAKIGYVRLTTGSLVTDGSAANTSVTWYNTAPSGDWMLTKIIVSATSATGVGDLADCVLYVFVTDGTTDRIIRQVDIGNPSAGSATAPGGQFEINFGPEFVFPSTVLPEFALSATPTAGNADIVVFAQMV